MTNAIRAGTILIEEGTLLPECLRFQGEPYSSGWRAAGNLDRHTVDQRVRAAGWSFFYLAGGVRASVFGFNRGKAIGRAVSRLLVNLKAEKFNSLEITQVAAKRFLGIPYVTVFARQRHIQESMVLFRSERPAERDRRQLAAA